MAYIKKRIRLPWEGAAKDQSPNWAANKEDAAIYNSVRWRQYAAIFRAKNPLCAFCQKEGITRVGDLVDHILAVNDGGDFWDEDNLQTLCTSHHNSKSATEGHARRRKPE